MTYKTKGSPDFPQAVLANCPAAVCSTRFWDIIAYCTAIGKIFYNISCKSSNKTTPGTPSTAATKAV